MADNLITGIGSFWTQFFESRDQLEGIGYSFREALGIAYNELSNVILTTSHKDAPVHNRTRWFLLELRADQKEQTSTGFRFPNKTTFHTKGVRAAQIILTSPADPIRSYLEQQDYTIGDGWIEFSEDPFTVPGIKITEFNGQFTVKLWAPVADIDDNLVWKHFGHFLGDWRFSSERYKDFTRGMFHSRMLGPIVNRIETGMQLMAGLPVASENENEAVQAVVQTTDTQIVRTNFREYLIPNGINITVAVGDTLIPFQTLTDAVTVSDHILEPGWWQGFVSQLPVEIGTTVDIDKAFEQYLKYNTFLVRVNLLPFLSDLSGLTNSGVFNSSKLVDFINQFKPSYTYAFPLFLLGIREELAPTVTTEALPIIDALEDRHFGFPSYNTLYNGLNFCDNIDLQSTGTTTGISRVEVDTLPIFSRLECYQQIPFLKCDTELGFDLRSELELVDQKHLSSKELIERWCSPVVRRPYNLHDGLDFLQNLNLSSLFYEFVNRNLAMGFNLSQILTLGKVSDCGYVEETTVARSAVSVIDQLLADNPVAEASSVDTENMTFDVFDLSSGYNLHSGITLGSQNSRELAIQEPESSTVIDLHDEDCPADRHNANLSDGLHLQSGTTIGDTVRDLIWFDMSDSITMRNGFNMHNHKPFCVADDVHVETLHVAPVDMEPTVESAAALQYEQSVNQSFAAFTLSDGKTLNDNLALGQTGSIELASKNVVSSTMEDLTQVMKEALVGPFDLSDNQNTSTGIDLSSRIRETCPYDYSDGQNASSGLDLDSIKSLGFIESFSVCEIAAGMYSWNIIPAGPINGVNTQFLLPTTPFAGSLELYIDGALLVNGIDYTEASGIIQFAVAPVSATMVAFYRNGAANTVFIMNETPTGLINGSNHTYLLAHTADDITGLRIFLDGLLVDEGSYRHKNNTLTIFSPPNAGSTLSVYYRLPTNECFIDHESPFVLSETIEGFIQPNMVQLNFVQTGLLQTLTLAHTPLDGQVMLYIGGNVLISGIDYILTGNIITVLTTQSGTIAVFYRI